MSQKVHVIGAGFAGLTISLRLAQKGFKVNLYERTSRVGGLLGTEMTEHGLAEHAANALIRTYKAEALFNELGLVSVLPLKESKKRFIFRHHPRRWPLSLIETLQAASKFLPAFLFNKKSLHPKRQETLQTWGQRHLGRAATQYLLGPAMQGIYASDADVLSSDLILGPAFRRKGKTGAYRGLLTGINGMQSLVDALEKKLKTLGVDIHCNASVNLATLQGPVVIATSGTAAAGLLEIHEPAMAKLLKRINTTSLISVKLFFKTAQSKYKGFGCLIPSSYKMKTLGVLMNTYIFPDRDKAYNETWILGGADAEELHETTDTDILKWIAEERFKILGTRDALLDYRLHRWKNALPLYDLELEKVLNELKSLPTSRFYLHGNYLGGIGLSKILDRSDELAEQLAQEFLNHG